MIHFQGGTGHRAQALWTTELGPSLREWRGEASGEATETQELKSEGCLGVSPMEGRREVEAKQAEERLHGERP